MKIETEQDMKDFCEKANSLRKPFRVQVDWTQNSEEYNLLNKEMINKGIIGKNSHLQQGIDSYIIEKYSRMVQDIEGIDVENIQYIIIAEKPYLYPSPRLLEEHPELTGSMTGILDNCYDSSTKRFLFHMRGTNISAPFGFQAAAAGMGVYGQNPGLTAALELYQEAGLEKFRQFPRNGLAIDVLPFMKAGKIPQPLFSFGFSADLSEFPVCGSLDDIAEFETKIKKGLQEKTVQQREGYHFTIPYQLVERITGELNDKKRFYGPIFDSTMNFVRALKDSKVF